MKSHLPESSRPSISWDTHNPDQPAIHDDGRREPRRANQALLDYLHLGPGRTIPALLHRYQMNPFPPTRSMLSLRQWSSRYQWPQRVAAFDEIENREVQAKYHFERNAILRSGVALEHERVEYLGALYKRLSSFIQSEDVFWTKHVKAVNLGQGQVERYEWRRFNGDLVRYLRGLLRDIAHETGGRKIRLNRPESRE